MTIIITENQKNKILSLLVNEEVVYLGDKEKIVIDWLNKHFKPIEIQTNDSLSLPKLDKAVSVLDPYGQITKQLKNLEEVYYIMQTKFKKILYDKQDRNKFLWEILNKWYK